MRKVVPRDGSDHATKMRPRWYCSTMRLAKASPRPHPRFLVVNPGLNTVLWFLRGIPFPVSVTVTQARLPSVEVVTSIEPEPSMASTAFFIRFSMTHSKSGALMSTGNGCGDRLVVRLMRDDMRVCM